MTTHHHSRVAELVAEYRRSREQLAAMHRELASISATAASEDGMVTVTVGTQGRLVDLVISDGAYRRYRPAELARVVVGTTAVAAAKAAEAASRTVGPLLPMTADPDAVLAGTADLAPHEMTPAKITPESASAAPRRPAVAEAEESFEDRNWLATSDDRRTSG